MIVGKKEIEEYDNRHRAVSQQEHHRNLAAREAASCFNRFLGKNRAYTELWQRENTEETEKMRKACENKQEDFYRNGFGKS